MSNFIRKPSVLDKNNIKYGKRGKRPERKVERQNRKKQKEKQGSITTKNIGFLSMNVSRIKSW